MKTTDQQTREQEIRAKNIAACGRKVFYAERPHAEAMAMHHSGKKKLAAYKCPVCPGYHIGSRFEG